MRTRTLLLCLVPMMGLLIAAPAMAQAPDRDAYKYSQPDEVLQVAVPDVDKAAGAPAPDNSCWQATAANLLAGAGWGKAGNNPQQNADAIYGHMTNHFGLPLTGNPHIAINWWLMMVGTNPSAATNPDTDYYNPTYGYTDVTRGGGYIDDIVYNGLLDEINRCQYVGVGFAQPNNDVGHAMTLVGGNYAGNPSAKPGGDTSIWHDSDRDLGNGPDGVNDDELANWWVSAGVPGMAGQWWLDMNNNGTYDPPEAPDPDWEANSYTTLCPGLTKNQDAIENYDVAYFTDLNPLYGEMGEPQWKPRADVRGTAGYGDVIIDDQEYTVFVPNDDQVPPEFFKEIWLLIDYFDRDNAYADAAGDPYVEKDIVVELPDGTFVDPTTVDPNGDLGQLLYYWKLDDQPAWEKIHFPNANYIQLTGEVKDWNLATLCTPEPATMALMALGLAALVRRRRR